MCQMAEAFSVFMSIMGNSPRYLSPRCSLVEVTLRTVQGRYLLKPSDELNAIIIGALARAAELYPVGVVCPSFLSNHGHLLLRPTDQKALSGFMGYFTSKIAREIGKLYDWPGGIFPTPYRCREVSDEEEAQVDRLRYVLAQGVKEGLVESPLDWPGVHGAKALLEGEPLDGVWRDRTAEYHACRGQAPTDSEAYETVEQLTLEPLPCWDHLPVEERRRRIAEILREIEAAGRLERRRTGSWPKGAAAVKAMHPHHRPRAMERRPVSRFHAVRQRVRKELAEAYRLFLEAYRTASQALRSGEEKVLFPPGCFPPGLPFVPIEPVLKPP